MARRRAASPFPRTFLVECFAANHDDWTSGPRSDEFLGSLAITDDEQLLVVVRGRDAATVADRCRATGLTVDRVVEVELRPRWRWTGARPARHPGRRR